MPDYFLSEQIEILHCILVVWSVQCVIMVAMILISSHAEEIIFVQIR